MERLRWNINTWSVACISHLAVSLQCNYIWGWDPKEDEKDHQGYQGSTLGCPLNPAHVGGADCIIWATGEEAFLECVKNGVRTSAGFWGYGHWTLQALYSTC